MRKTVGILLSMTLALYSKELSRADLLRAAFENSEVLKQIEQERSIATSIKKEYFGKGLPTIEGVAQYEHKLKSYNPFDFALGGAGGSLTDALTEDATMDEQIIAGAFDKMTAGFSTIDLTPKKNSAAFGVKISQPIFAQGKVFTGVKIANVYAQGIEQKYEAGQFRLAKEITNSYNGALLAHANIHIQEQAVELAEETHRLTKAKQSTGRGTVLDTLNTRYSLQSARFALRSAKKDKQLAVQNMLTIASLDTDPESVILTDTLERLTFDLSKENAFAQLLKENRNITQLNKAEEIKKYQTKLTKSDFYPMIFAGASFMGVSQYDSVDDIEFGGDHKLHIGLSLPLFSGGQRVQRVKQANMEEVKFAEQKSEVTNQFYLALTVGYEELAVAQEEIVAAEEMVALSEQAYRISMLAYEVGQITQLDLTASEQQLSMARLAMNNAIYKVNLAVTGINELIAEPTLIEIN